MEISKFVLGTVQLGMPYGINNTTGQPSEQESMEILETAIEGGINIIDTAFAYGTAEERIGQFISRHPFMANTVKIISKLQPHIITEESESISEQKVCNIVEEAIQKSLDRMCISKLNGYLLHTPQYVYNKKVMGALCRCKEKRLTDNIGVSIYEVDEALYAANLADIDYIQIPFNVFDQRLARDDFYQLTKKNHITVFARSPFLQGLVFKNPNDASVNIPKISQYLSQLRDIIKTYNIRINDVALFFSYITSGADYIVFGAETVWQMKENLQSTHIKKSDELIRCVKELKVAFSDIEKHIIFPSLWKDSFK